VAKVNTAPDKSEIVITPEEPDTTPPPPPTPEPPKATAIVDSSKNGAKPADLYHTSGRSIEQDAKDGGDVVSGIVYPIISSNEYEEAWFEFTDKITPEELDKYNVQLVVANYKSGEPIQRAIARSNPNKRSSSDVLQS
jgi:lysophospholipase L1-like esterase